MKQVSTFAVIIFLLCSFTSFAQFGGFLKKAEEKVKEKVDQAEDTVIDKAANPGSTSQQKNDQSGNEVASTENSNASSNQQPEGIRTYKNYDFVPGDTIIFESQLEDEETGEIPSQFTLSNGQMDVQTEDGVNVIHVPKGPGATFTPRMSNSTYMPDRFTIEFDFKNEQFGLNHLMIDFGQRVYYSGGEGITPGMTFGSGSITWTLGGADYPDELKKTLDSPMKWHHIAIAINKSVGKVYVDQFRIVNVNNLTGKPKNVTIDVNGYEGSFIKNIRIASGGINIYKKITTMTRIITHRILFDVDKATIEPQSMGTINEIYKLLQKNSSLKFEIDGYTDNTGNAGHNLELSKERADAVKTQLVSMGIDSARLTTNGFGDTKPIDSNDTPEGKANNRRVEFVKI
jgi:outer membrane protein OmpA-like peptidoglycan-associated protein